jgi:hypothetical protein
MRNAEKVIRFVLLVSFQTEIPSLRHFCVFQYVRARVAMNVFLRNFVVADIY